MLGLPADRRMPAAVEEVSQIITTETNHLADLGLFSLPAEKAAQLIENRKSAKSKNRHDATTPRRAKAGA